MSKHCANCNLKSSPGLRFSTFQSKLHRTTTNLTVGKALSSLGQFKIIDNDKNSVCNTCYNILSTYGKAFEKAIDSKNEFLSRMHGTSPIAGLMVGKPSAPAASLAPSLRSASQTRDRDSQAVTSQEDSSDTPPSAAAATILVKRKQISTPIHRKIPKSLTTCNTRRSFQRTICRLTRGEMQLVTKSNIFNKKGTTDSTDLALINSEAHEFVRSRTPIIFAILNGLCRSTKGSEEWALTVPMAVVLSVAAMSKNKECNRMQRLISLLLWQTKASKKTFFTLNNLKLCVAYGTTNSMLDSMCLGYDAPLLLWKTELETVVGNSDYVDFQHSADGHGKSSQPNPGGTEKRKADSTPSKSDNPPTTHKKGRELFPAGTATTFASLHEDVRPLPMTDYELDDENNSQPGSEPNAASSGAELTETKTGERKYLGVSITFDNLNKHHRPREYSTTSTTKVTNVVSAAAYFSRISLNLDEFVDLSVVPASEVPIESFLPSPSDEQLIYSDCQDIVKRILIKNVPLFHGLATWRDYDKRLYENESANRTVVVNLGLLNHDENTNTGMLSILEEFQRYAPRDKKGKLFPLVIRGDGLTADRARSAQFIRLNAKSEPGKLSNQFPIVSDWHKQVILSQDHINRLFRGNEYTLGKGTLPQLRAAYGHKLAGLDLKTRYNYTVDLWRFSLEAYVTALAQINLESKGEFLARKGHFSMDNLLSLLDSTSKFITDFCWHKVARATGQQSYCFCNDSDENKESFVACENFECKVSWFHTDCIKAHIAKCKSEKVESYYKPLPKKGSKAKWFCSDDCEVRHSDGIVRYTRGLMYTGLMHAAYHRAIRQNNGERFPIFNKFHMVQFHHSKHPVYFRLATRMHLYMSGCAPACVRHEMIWNSTINLTGKYGHNLEVDLTNEHMNKFFKDHVLNVSNQTDESILRRSRAFGISKAITDEMSKFLTSDGGVTRAGKDYEKWKTDLPSAITTLRNANVFSHVGKRHHPGFEAFDMKYIFIDDIDKYKSAIKEQVLQFDLAQACLRKFEVANCQRD